MTSTIQALQLLLLLIASSNVSSLINIRPQKQQMRPGSELQSVSTKVSADNTLTVTPIKSLDGTVTLPGSKSLSNRCLLLAALSEGDTKVDNLLESDDIRYMLEALDQLEVPVEKHSADSVTVTGQAGPINSPTPDKVCELFLGNAGTAMRPLAAALCMGQGRFVLDGVPRMRERPIADLMDGLQQLGADATCVAETGCPPVTINANGLKGGTASISGKMSSQFLSSLLMAAPAVDGDVTIKIKDELISAPYVALTIGLMKKFGVDVEVEGEMDGGTPSFHIPASARYTSPKSILVEGDASSASYFIAGAAITGGTVTVRGCGSESVQGDVAFANVMEQMGPRRRTKGDALWHRQGGEFDNPISIAAIKNYGRR